MTVDDRTVELRGDRVLVLRRGVEVASGRWYAGRIVDRVGEPDAADADAWTTLETLIRSESEALVQSTAMGAYDERGVDVSQIDRMLALPPRERLRMLEVQCRSILRLLDARAAH